MESSKTIFIPTSFILQQQAEPNPRQHVKWIKELQHNLGSSQFITVLNHGRRPFMPAAIDAAIHAIPFVPLTEQQRLLKRTSDIEIDTWNSNCFKIQKMIQLSIDIGSRTTCQHLWDLTLHQQEHPDVTIRQILLQIRHEHVGLAGDNQHIHTAIREINDEISRLPECKSDNDVHHMFIKLQNLLQELTNFGQPNKTEQELRQRISSTMKHMMFHNDRASINAHINPPTTITEIKRLWLHHATRTRQWTIPTTDQTSSHSKSIYSVSQEEKEDSDYQPSYASTSTDQIPKLISSSSSSQFPSLSSSSSQIAAFTQRPLSQRKQDKDKLIAQLQAQLTDAQLELQYLRHQQLMWTGQQRTGQPPLPRQPPPPPSLAPRGEIRGDPRKQQSQSQQSQSQQKQWQRPPPPFSTGGGGGNYHDPRPQSKRPYNQVHQVHAVSATDHDDRPSQFLSQEDLEEIERDYFAHLDEGGMDDFHT